eukprot:gene17251-26483_t
MLVETFDHCAHDGGLQEMSMMQSEELEVEDVEYAKYAAVSQSLLVEGKDPAADTMLSLHDCRAICLGLPNRYLNTAWRLIYSSKREGFSTRLLLQKSAAQRLTRNAIVVTCTDGFVFGAFASDGYHRSSEPYGNRECLLFTLQDIDLERGIGPKVYKSTGRDSAFMGVTTDGDIYFGGGSSPGLKICEGLQFGTTGACLTYASKPLVDYSPYLTAKQLAKRRHTTEEQFYVRHIEVYAVDWLDATLLEDNDEGL